MQRTSASSLSPPTADAFPTARYRGFARCRETAHAPYSSSCTETALTMIPLQNCKIRWQTADLSVLLRLPPSQNIPSCASMPPDAQDEKELASFAQIIREHIASDAPSTPLNLPGNRPYREYDGVPIKPQASQSCTRCGLCAKECPVGAIDTDSPSKTDTHRCISCMRCIAVCPQKARSVSSILLAASSMKLKKACSGYKHNELFLPQQ